MSQRKSTFGRDEMTALLGGGLSETLLRQAPAAALPGQKKKIRSGKDVADMTTQEAAAFLLQQQQQKLPPVESQTRHRTKKRREYHQLLLEQQQQQQQYQAEQTPSPQTATKRLQQESSFSSSDDDDNYDEKALPTRTARPKKAPVIIGKRRRLESSSSDDAKSNSSDNDSSSDEEDRINANAKPRKGDDDSGGSSSSSDDESVTNRRRQRLQKLRQQAMAAAAAQKPFHDESAGLQQDNVTVQKQLDLDPIVKEKSKHVERNESSGDDGRRGTQKRSTVKAKPKDSSTDSSSDGSGGSSSEDSSSDSSDEDDVDAPPAPLRPVFIPKHKRQTVEEEDPAEEELAEQKRREREKRRKKESRALVQQAVSETKAATEATPEGFTSAQNARPDDTDDKEAEARDAWEVRELVRLLANWDREQARLREEAELRRRRAMTDEERLQEDMAAGRYRKPGEQREESKMVGRYHHKGAFYMDEQEWDESDVRHKADEYSKSATGDDKINRDALPNIMKKVKKLGFANQSKYKGLAAEDTTDRGFRPLSRSNQKKKS